MFIVVAICEYGDKVDIISLVFNIFTSIASMSTSSFKIFDSNLICASALRWASRPTLQSNFFNIQVTEHSLS